MGLVWGMNIYIYIWGCIGIAENNMETTIVSFGFKIAREARAQAPSCFSPFESA